MRSLLPSLLALALVAGPATAQQQYRQTLLGLDGGLIEQSVKSKAVTPDCPHPWWVNLSTMHGGKQEGVRMIEMSNGRLFFVVLVSRGMGIQHVSHQDAKQNLVWLGWESPVQEVVHPALVNLTARGGLGWLEGFTEFLCRCGLENVGQPGKDELVTNTGAKAEIDLTLHGKIANIPARELEVVVDKQAPYRVRLRGRVDERMMFGPKLELHTELSTVPGTFAFRVEDVVVNKGAQPQEFQVLYHTNLGKPLLSEGARVLAPVQRVTPFNDNAARDVKRYGAVAGPTPGFVEQVYLMRPVQDKDGRTVVLVHNKDEDQGMSVRYGVKELPYLTLWKNTAAVEDGYVIGVEPGTSFPNTRKVERQNGRVPKLAPGGAYKMTLDFEMHVGRDSVRRVVEEIEALQRSQPLTIDEAPAKQ